ncbi:hypothetical protein Lal_00010064, partial [Lupinus albus]
MTYDRELFNELDKTAISKVRIGNQAYVVTKGKKTKSLKLIHDVLYVSEINQNSLCVPQLMEKGYKVLFEESTTCFKIHKAERCSKLNKKQKFSLGFDERW